MAKGSLKKLGIILLVLTLRSAVLSAGEALRYPCYLIEAYDADPPFVDCWTGGDLDGRWPAPVVPKQWLVGPPPSDGSCVTLPPDHWVELAFPGRIVDGPGDDIIILELGQCGEEALVFITDGMGQEYLLDKIAAGDSGEQTPTVIGLNIANISFPFKPCAVRILGMDQKGGLPGFDVGSIQARTSTDCGKSACNPYPPDGAEDVQPDTVLSWSPGSSAEKHRVYFGTSIADVHSNASPVSNPPQPQDANSFDPIMLYLGQKYYWRVDEVNSADPNSPWTGNIWSFKVADRIVIDDFESYNIGSNKIYNTWLSVGQAGVDLSTGPVYRCGHSMVVNYYYDDYFYSEVIKTFGSPQDWASAGARVLELFFRGNVDNLTDGLMMYLSLSDAKDSAFVQYVGDSNDFKKETWRVWRIDLLDFADIDLNHVTDICIGICQDRTKPSGYGAGKIYFDDIMLYPRMCFEENRPAADFTGDCTVDLEELQELAYSWLDTGYNVYQVTEPNEPVAWYKFDGNTQDSAGSAHGDPCGSPSYVSGVYGQAIRFDGYKDYVVIANANEIFSKIDTQITIGFWQYGSDSPHLTDTVCCSNYVYGAAGPAIAINLGCWRRPSKFNWDSGFPWSLGGRLSANHRYKSEWAGRWNHWAFIRNNGWLEVFLNGALYDNRADANSLISGITSFTIGTGWYGGYDGLLDDFRIYDYALSQPQVAYIATNGTGIFDQTLMSPADLFEDGKINFKDFALLADEWLAKHLWP